MTEKRTELLQTVLSPKMLSRAERAVLFIDGMCLYQWLDGNESRSKFVSPAAIKAAFAGQGLDTGWMPPGVVRWGSAAGGDWFVQYLAPAQYDIGLEVSAKRVTKLQVKMPGFVFAGCGARYYVWAVKETFKPGITLFHAPVPNVYGDGHICWGANKIPKVSALGVMQAWKLFWSAPFNGHLANGKSRKFPADCRKQMQAKARVFPVADLVTANASIDRMVESFMKGEKDGDGMFDGGEMEDRDDW